MVEAKKKGCEIILPIDAVVAREFKEGVANEVVAIDKVPRDAMILDIGPRSIAHLVEVLEGSGRCFGTARWAPLKSLRSARARLRWRARPRVNEGRKARVGRRRRRYGSGASIRRT